MELNGEESMIEELIEDKPIFKIKNKNTGVLERKVLVECEDCKKQRFQRIDKFKHRKSDLCHYCNSKKILLHQYIIYHQLDAIKNI